MNGRWCAASERDPFVAQAPSPAGGVDLDGARSAIFNGANIVVANIVHPDKPWTGIPSNADVPGIARQFLETIE